MLSFCDICCDCFFPPQSVGDETPDSPRMMSSNLFVCICAYIECEAVTCVLDCHGGGQSIGLEMHREQGGWLPSPNVFICLADTDSKYLHLCECCYRQQVCNPPMQTHRKRLTETDRQAHEFLHNPVSTAGTCRRYPTEIIQCKHTARLSFLFVCLFFLIRFLQGRPVSSLHCFPLSLLLFHQWTFSSFHLSFLLALYSPLISPKHRCNSNSHHNPVSCLLNTSQVHTPHSCSATEITQPRTNMLPDSNACTQIAIRNDERL